MNSIPMTPPVIPRALTAAGKLRMPVPTTLFMDVENVPRSRRLTSTMMVEERLARKVLENDQRIETATASLQLSAGHTAQPHTLCDRRSPHGPRFQDIAQCGAECRATCACWCTGRRRWA